MNRPALLCVLLLLACGSLPLEPVVDAGTMTDPDAGIRPPDTRVADSGTLESRDAGSAPDPRCPPGLLCVTQFPYTNTNDTSTSSISAFAAYDCAPNTNESGKEIVYRVTVPVGGFLSAAVYSQPGVDVDVHILSALDANACLSRGNLHAKADVAAGTYFVVVDSFVGGGVPRAGAYRVDIGFLQPSKGPCQLSSGLMPRVNDNGNPLAMPATGKMAVEAHLVTKEEPPPYPAAPRERVEAHGALSQSRTGFVMHRTQAWAPLEGGSFYGAGIGSPTLFPVEHEAWYINMYWTSAARPPRGTRMIARLPNSPRAVVVAAGYETGPGDLTWIGGTPEETHFYLGTGHGGVMTIGIATDQSLPFGLRECSP